MNEQTTQVFLTEERVRNNKGEGEDKAGDKSGMDANRYEEEKAREPNTNSAKHNNLLDE